MATYHHYIQKYPVDNVATAEEDIEAAYDCVYQEFSGTAFDGDIKNTYSEEYAEHDGARVYMPAPDKLAFKTYECTLSLLFKKNTCQNDARRFYEAFRGRRVEYHDTFRKRYLTLLMTKQPKIKQEILYGNRPYQLVEFTFTNINGRAYSSSMLKEGGI